MKGCALIAMRKSSVCLPEKLHTCQYMEYIYIVRFRVGDTIQVQLAYIQSKYNDLKSNTTTELYT